MEQFTNTFDNELDPAFHSHKLLTLQRDTRSSYRFKSLTLIWLPILCTILLISISVGFIYVRNDCHPAELSHVDETFLYVSYSAIAIGALLLAISLMFHFRWKWAWYTTNFSKNKQGRDIEDIDPFYLMRSGQQMQKKSNQFKSQFDTDKTNFYIDFDKNTSLTNAN
jgi:hypothetical protein